MTSTSRDLAKIARQRFRTHGRSSDLVYDVAYMIWRGHRDHAEFPPVQADWLAGGLPSLMAALDREAGRRWSKNQKLGLRDFECGYVDGNVFWELVPPRATRAQARRQRLDGPSKGCMCPWDVEDRCGCRYGRTKRLSILLEDAEQDDGDDLTL